MPTPPIIIEYEGQKVIIQPDSWLVVEDDMMAALNSITPRYAEASGLLAHVKEQLSTNEAAFKKHYSVRYHQLKGAAYEQLYQRKPTEQALEYALDEDPVCLQFKAKSAALQKVIDQLYGVLHALDSKLDVLKEMGSHTRQQLRLREHA